MALTSVGIIHWPPVTGLSITTSARLLDAANEAVAAIFSVPRTGNIRKVHFATTTVTTGATVDVRIETVSTTDGTPTGTLWGTNTNVAHVIADTDDNLWLTTAALTADAAVTAGDVIAVNIVNPAVSFGNFNIAHTGTWSGGNLPYIAHYTGSWTKTDPALRLAVEYSDGTIPAIPGMEGSLNLSADILTTANNWRASKLTMPFTCRAIGMWYLGYNSGSSGTYTGKLFDTDGASALATVTQDTDIRVSAAAEISRLMFATPVTLSAGSTYRVGLTSDGTAAVRAYYFTYNSAALLNALSPSSSYAIWTQTSGTPTGTGDWSDTNTRVALYGLIIDQIDVSSGPLVGPGRLIRN